MIKWLKHYLQPKEQYPSIFDITYKRLLQHGMKNICFDVDNTIIERFKITPEWKVKQLLQELADLGFNLLLISNNSDKRRLIRICEFLEVSVIVKSFKPLPWIYKKIEKDFNFQPKETIFIGDQLFTDVFGANLFGFYSIYVDQMGNEDNLRRKILISIEKTIINYLNKLKKDPAVLVPE